MSMSVYIVDGPKRGLIMEFPDNRGHRFLTMTPTKMAQIADDCAQVFGEHVKYTTKRYEMRHTYRRALTVVKDDPLCHYDVNDVDWLLYCGKAEQLDAVATVYCYCAATDWDACDGFIPDMKTAPAKVSLYIPDIQPGWRSVHGNQTAVESDMLSWLKMHGHGKLDRFPFRGSR